MRSLTQISLALLVVASPTLHGFLEVGANKQWPRGGNDRPAERSRYVPFTTITTSPPFQSSTAQASSWSSYATVDPSRILTLLMKYAGFFLDEKLQQLAFLLHCDKAQLNVVNRELLIHNFTVSIPNQVHKALRIGRIHVTWDSYNRPCLEVEVEDVDIMVEFTNLLLTRNNWNELNDLGFPPQLVYYNTTTHDGTTRISKPTTDTGSEYLRIGSLDLQGRVALQTRSRPLNKAILPDDIVLHLRTLKDLNYKIRALSEQNLSKYNRRGLTSDQIYEVMSKFFNAKLREALRSALEDIATSQLDPNRTLGNTRLANQSKSLVSSAKAALLSYVADIETLSKEKVKGKLLDVQGEDGDKLVPDEEVDRIMSESLATLKDTAASVGVNALRSFRGWFQTSSHVGNETSSDLMDDDNEETILFPDW